MRLQHAVTVGSDLVRMLVFYPIRAEAGRNAGIGRPPWAATVRLGDDITMTDMTDWTSVVTFGCALSVLAGLFLAVGLIPFLGWLNWFTSLPLSILGAVFCYLTLRERPDTPIAQFGLVASVLLLCITLFRLAIGGGVI